MNVKWFYVNPTLTNKQISEKLGNNVTPKKEGDLDGLFVRDDSFVAFRPSATMLRINANEEDLLAAARSQFGGEVGES